MLREEITKRMKLSTFANTVCVSYEGGKRHTMLQQGNKLPEDTISNISSALQFSPLQSVIFAFALTQSQHRSVVLDAIKFIKTKIPEVVSVSTSNTAIYSEINEDVLQNLAVFVANTEELSTLDASRSFITTLRSLPTSGSSNNSASSSSSSSVGDTDLDIAQALSASTRQRMSAASVLSDINVQCSTSVDTFRQTLSDIGIVIDEEQLAEIIVTFLTRNNGIDANSVTSQPWNLDVVGTVLNQECRNLNWTLVAQRLDQPHLSVKNEGNFSPTFLNVISNSGLLVLIVFLICNSDPFPLPIPSHQHPHP